MRFVWLWVVVTCLAVTASLAGLSSLVEAEPGTTPLVTVDTAERPPTSAATTTSTRPGATAPTADPPPGPPQVARRGAGSGEGDDEDDD